MKRITLTIGLLVLLLIAEAQERNETDRRSRLTVLLETKDEKAVLSSLKKLEKSKTEEDKMLAYAYYSKIGNEEKVNLLNEQIVKVFPNGQLALQSKIEMIRQITDLADKDAKFQSLLRDNPDAPVGFDAYSMAMAYAAEGNLPKMNAYADFYGSKVTDQYGNKIDKRSIMAGLAPSLMHSKPEAAVPLFADGLDYYRISLSKPEEGATEDIRQQRRARGEQTYYVMLANYVEALLSTGRKEEALQIVAAVRHEMLTQENKENSIFLSLESAYLNALLANERYGDALPLLEEAYIKATSGRGIEEHLRKGYIAKNGSTEGIDTYLGSLTDAKQTYESKELMKRAISQKAPDFQLRDVDGNIVKLADLKGKVVVLDFWATWCGPCKASFPAMQKAVNKYKDDVDVRFLFLHTWEKGSGDPTVGAKKYVIDNNYSFEVLMDLRDPATTESAVAKAYGVKGIPTKIIIDPHGQIRFNTSGFSADEEKAVSELAAMIEYAKKS
ncbi:TlpA family protein disulfide reductase [Sphingobacterium paucimobilis]|uniref:Thioredoxin domain-containing protein n=1 Tax=Sphingobacterium paucimobilis HER1398 TaxID=1346330 RepID=U2HB94_9SPHI|nr:TlpA disulfide reductase family protein [Sphingobacterium paucimobilis]ERJ59011.1 hypothetical protein M472_09535 [Sphingobacterium paucimobilis HER1398]